MHGFTHFNENGDAIMVDVSGKDITERQAKADGKIRMSVECYEAVRCGTVSKGDVLGVSRIAGIMALKRTAELIPLCHTLTLEKASIDFELNDEYYEIRAVCTVKTKGLTGVEMEALMGVSATLLTIYDMCKAIDKKMEITGIKLLEKTGGKSGAFQRK